MPARPLAPDPPADAACSYARQSRQKGEQLALRRSKANPSGKSAGNLQFIMREMTAQGKRLRPTFLVIAGRLLGCNSSALIDAGCAIEMIHAASLAVDDLPCMDNSVSRRGLPAIHVRFGDAAAILGAVSLIGRAFQTVTSPDRFPLETRGALAAVLARTIGSDALPGGQFDDLNLVKGAPGRRVTANQHAQNGRTVRGRGGGRRVRGEG